MAFLAHTSALEFNTICVLFANPFTNPLAVSASLTSRCTTVQDRRPKPWFAQPVPHEFWMSTPLAS